MEYKISNTTVVYKMDKTNKPVLRVKPKSEILIETKDCFGNQLHEENVQFDSLDWDRINPATGPIYIEGAEKGDILSVHIKNIKLTNKACMVTGKDMGVYGNKLNDNQVKILDIIDDTLIFNDKIKIPIDPMIGVIGVAPENEGINCGTPGTHGGNMDCKKIRKGSRIYFPVFTEGALLALGDMHAVMGDGEVSVCGAEIAGEILIEVDLIKNKSIESPVVLDDENIYFIYSDETLDMACEKATHLAVEFLKEKLEISAYDAVSLLSLVGNLAICQVVDPLKTVRMEIPKNIINTEDKNV